MYYTMVITGGATVTTNHPPPAYYTVNNPGNPMAVAMATIRRTEHLLFDATLPDQDTDFDQVVATWSIATGYTRRRVTDILMALYQLRDLPLLHALQHQLFHLDPQRLIAITNALAGLNPGHLATVDELLTDYLTPTAPNQVLPTPRSISTRIKVIREMVQDPRAGGDNGPEKKDFGVTTSPDGLTEFYGTVDTVTGHLIDDAVAAHAQATGKTKGEAFADLLLSKISVKVTLNLYTASDLAEAPVWAGGIGWLDAHTGQHWADRADKVQDMDQAVGKHLKGHDPSPDIRAAVEGRDGTCRFPGCTVPAIRCDCDHRVNHADGGCTCTENLCCLCRHHHNDKTAGRVMYFMDPVTGIVVWLLADGTWAVTVPEGPLTPSSARWAQTVSQYRTAHRKRWAAAAKREAAAEAKAQSAGQDDLPPF